MLEGEIFISEIRNHPVLWDNKHSDFNNRHVKLAAWEDVASKIYDDSETWSRYDKFGKVREMQKRWKNMRDSFIRELKYQKKVDRGMAKPKKRRYVYSDFLSFLIPGNQEKVKSSCESEESGSDQEENENEENSSPMDFKCTVTMDSMQAATANDTNQNMDHHREGTSYLQDYLRQQGVYQNIAEQSNLERVQPYQTNNGQIVNSTFAVPADHTDLDDDKMFLLSLLPYFKKLDDAKKLHARIEFTKLLYDKVYKA